VTAYRLDEFTAADAAGLVGGIADITEWGDDHLETRVTYAGARVLGMINVDPQPYLVIESAGAVQTDDRSGDRLGVLPPAAEVRLEFMYICEVTDGEGDR
jgi:hypothetical protein